MHGWKLLKSVWSIIYVGTALLLFKADVASGQPIRPEEVPVESSTERQHAEVHSAVNPLDTANLVIGAMEFTTSGGLSCSIHYTRDFGETWQRSNFSPEILSQGGDPILAFDAEGTLYFCWLSAALNTGASTLFWATSTDGGEHWSEADTIIAGRPEYKGGERPDKPWLAVDRSDSPYRNTLYAAFMYGTFNTDPFSTPDRPYVTVRRKPAGADAFLPETIFISDDSFVELQFPLIDVDPEGRVHVTFWGTKEIGKDRWFALWHSVSVDGGGTFSAPRKITDLSFPKTLGVAIPQYLPVRFNLSPQLAIDKSFGPRSGWLYQVWTANDAETPSENTLERPLDIYLSRSTDGGDSWNMPRIVNSNGHDDTFQFYPSVAVTPNGVVTVSWYDGRDDRYNRTTHYYTAYSTDGGETFREVRVSTAGTDISTIGLKNTFFCFGEYTQMMAVAGHAVPVWIDGRSNDGDLNIYVAMVPLGEDASAVHEVTPITGDVAVERPIPNPGSENVIVPLRLQRKSSVRLEILDNLGQRLRSEPSAWYEAGNHSLLLNVADLASGTYYVRVFTDFGYAVRKLHVVN